MYKKYNAIKPLKIWNTIIGHNRGRSVGYHVVWKKPSRGKQMPHGLSHVGSKKTGIIKVENWERFPEMQWE